MQKMTLCPYPFLTPHITLAYFNYNGFGAPPAEKLKAAVYELNQKQFAVTLRTNDLYYQKFTSMNDYISVFPFA